MKNLNSIISITRYDNLLMPTETNRLNHPYFRTTKRTANSQKYYGNFSPRQSSIFTSRAHSGSLSLQSDILKSAFRSTTQKLKLPVNLFTKLQNLLKGMLNVKMPGFATS